jgi:PAS domain S-box-containing protein
MPTPHEILELVADTVFVVDRHGRLLLCNDSAEALLGFAREELLGSYMIEHVHPDDRGDTLNAIWRVMTGSDPVKFENRWRHKDGHDVPIQWNSRWSARHEVRVAVARMRA